MHLACSFGKKIEVDTQFSLELNVLKLCTFSVRFVWLRYVSSASRLFENS